MLLAALAAARCARSNKPVTSKSGRARRPPGKPKPMVEEDIGPALARLDAWYALLRESCFTPAGRSLLLRRLDLSKARAA